MSASGAEPPAAGAPEVRFFNTLGRRIERFEPIAPPRVGLYTCGPTVYNHVHIGNLRTFLFEDLLCRSLRFLGYDVFQVMNLTDVDDRTIQGAQAAQTSLDEFTAPFIESFHNDLSTLGVTPANVYPRATHHVAEMIGIIERLLARGFAYESDGSIWFRIASDPDYGRLSGIDLSGARQGARVSSDDYEKEDAKDFVLWKGAKPDEPAWDSPWGPGRPGWHIECSAMSARYLGETFDIHCGGVDNIFPHHENEIAQSESANDRPFVRYWLHSEHLLVDGEKMSKRLGNQYTLRDLLERGLSPRAIRYALVSVHYRQKLNFTFEGLKGSASALKRFDEMRFRLAHAAATVPAEAGSEALAGRTAAFLDAFRSGLADDLNVSAALAALFDLVRDVNVAIERGEAGRVGAATVERALRDADRALGVLFWEEAAEGRSGAEETLSEADIEAAIARRQEARRRRDFRESDRIRDDLAQRGVLLEDTPQGTRWKRRSG